MRRAKRSMGSGKSQKAAERRRQQQTGMERIRILFSLAKQELERRPERSRRYVVLARKIAMRYNIKLPRSLKRAYCHACYRYLSPGVTCTVRARPSTQAMVIKCLACNSIMRYPYRRGK